MQHRLTQRTILKIALIGLIVFGLAAFALAASGAFRSKPCDTSNYNSTCVEDSGDPKISDVSPTVAKLNGESVVYIFGSHFGPGVQVWFDDKLITRVNVVNSTRLKVYVPATAEPRLVDVGVSRGNGPHSTIKDLLRYESELTVASISPSSGPVAGGTTVTIKGTGFAPDMYVDFGGDKPAEMKYINQTTMQVVTAPHEPGTTVVNFSIGEEELTKDDAFSFQ